MGWALSKSTTAGVFYVESHTEAVRPVRRRSKMSEKIGEPDFDRQDDRLCALEHQQKKKRGDLGSHNYEAEVTVDKR